MAGEVYRTNGSDHTAAGHGQVPAMTEHCAEQFRRGGFPAADVHLIRFTMKTSEATAERVVRCRGDGSSGQRPILMMAQVDLADVLPED